MALNNHLDNDNSLHALESSLASEGYPGKANIFLDTLFGEFTNCFVEIRLLHEGEKPIQFFYPSISAVQWGLIKEKNSEGYNCYFGVCLRKTQKGDKLSVASISALWADVDAKNFSRGKSEALAQLQKLPPYLFPSVIVDTGHGYHPYWLLREAELIESPQDILRLEAYMKGLAFTLHGDSTSDLSRVLRLPGLVNQKDAKNPCLCHIVHWEPERRFTPMDFDDYQAEIRESEPKRAGEAKKWPQRSDEFNTLAIEKLMGSCGFMQHCRDDADALSEPHWWSMVHILAVLGNPGRERIHELSAPYYRYTEEETEQKIKEALKAADKEIGPHTCAFIGEDLGFACPEDCLAKKWNLKSPTVLATRLARFGNLPRIVVTNRFLKEKTADTIAAVEQANQPPQIFGRSGHLVRIGRDELGVPYIEAVTESACRGFIERAAAYVKVNNEGKTIPLPAPPLDIVRDFMSLPHRNLPALLGITEVPILRGDGSILTEPGYDKATRLYYQPAPGLTIPTVSDNPTLVELQKAVALIQEPILDFPFDSEASRTNALALMITPVCRPMITGPVPLCLLDKPQAGTGAGLLSDVIAIIATGRPAAMMAPPKNDEECEKRLTSILRHGRAIITIDNMDGYLYFPSLSMILTATTVQTRILGQSEELLLPNRATYIVTGNNVRLAGDLPRRCYLSRMDARVARPWMRDPKNFKYEHLIAWVKENRGELLAAILTMARAWITAGKPITTGLPALGGFEDWVNIVGSILTHAGLGGFLENLDFMYSQSDVETAQWEAFFGTWHDIIGEEPVTSAELITHIKENPDLRSTLPDIIGDTEAKNYSVKVGQNLGKRNGVQYPTGLELKKAGTSHRAITWKVVKFTDSTSPLFSYKSEVSEVINTQAHKAFENSDKKEDKEDRNTYKSGVIPTSPTSHLATKQGEVDPWSGMPDFPHERCPTCGGTDFWPDFENKRFVCGRCHPQPKY